MRITTVLFLALVIASCSSNDEKQSSSRKSPIIKKNSKLVAPKRNTTVRFGEAIDFAVETRDGSTIDSIQLESPTESASFAAGSFTWTPSKPRAGSPKLRLVVYAGGKKESLYPKLRFLPTEEPREYSYRLINQYPHDENAWTQGLFILEDTLFEGTGSGGTSESVLRKIDLQTGKVYQELKLEGDLFGEGIAMHEDKIYQLTWQDRIGFVYDRSFNRLQTIRYPTEGWGLTNLGENLVMSDGSENLYIMEPDGFSEIDRLEVYDTKDKIDQLNELEMVEGLIYANVWFEEYIAMIDPQTGAVVGKIDLTGLMENNVQKGPDYVLNGIAYDKNTGHLIVTGKLYPLLFEIELIEKPTLN